MIIIKYCIYRENSQIFQNDRGNRTQSPSKNVVLNNCFLPKSHDNEFNSKQVTFLKKQNCENILKVHSKIQFDDNSRTLSTSIINKDLIRVIDNGLIRNMVNSTTQHPKTRNPTALAKTRKNTSNSTSTISTIKVIIYVFIYNKKKIISLKKLLKC